LRREVRKNKKIGKDVGGVRKEKKKADIQPFIKPVKFIS